MNTASISLTGKAGEAWDRVFGRPDPLLELIAPLFTTEQLKSIDPRLAVERVDMS